MVDSPLQSTADLLANLQESLSVEIKDWIDPSTPEGTAKIVKECFALRNYNGGDLVIGFDDKSLAQSTRNKPAEPRTAFHVDAIQSIISKYASDPFGVSIEFGIVNSIPHPIIRVPSGVRVPVAVKADLVGDGGKKWLSVDDVYFRTLATNNTPSSAKAKWKDWPNIVEICFDNREADIGRFLRRHLSGQSTEYLARILKDAATADAKDQATIDPAADELRYLVDNGKSRFLQVAKERGVSLPPHGTFQAGLIIDGEHPVHKPNLAFLNLLSSANPRLTGWPVWLDSRGFTDEGSRPHVYEGVWEAFIHSFDVSLSNHVDFYRYDPRGRFYMLRLLEDDVASAERLGNPLKYLEPIIAIYRVTETLAVGRNFARALGYDLDKTVLYYMLHWTGLKGRSLVAWANPGRYFSVHDKSHQDEVSVQMMVPSNTPDSAMPQYVKSALDPLFELFGGFEISDSVVEDIVRKVLERRW